MSLLRPVHPRGCGERDEIVSTSTIAAGSSPRVRGTLFVFVLVGIAPRFIPAGAGNARRRSVRRGLEAVHPRGCGERSCSTEVIQASLGSSPRVRGTRMLLSLRSLVLRFIPAGAGNALASA